MDTKKVVKFVTWSKRSKKCQHEVLKVRRSTAIGPKPYRITGATSRSLLAGISGANEYFGGSTLGSLLAVTLPYADDGTCARILLGGSFVS
jgi:hypothetical protein